MNTLTHGAGMLLALAGMLTALLTLGHTSWRATAGMTVFAAGMLTMYGCSTLYHWWHPGRRKNLWRKFDHMSIYVMIAASYTPVCLSVVGGLRGGIMCSTLWGLALAGIAYKSLWTGRHPRLSLALYLAMGWSVVFIVRPVVNGMPGPALALLAAEGVAYTAGTYFFAHDGQRFFHGIWHLFVLAGSVAHWLAIYLTLRQAA